MSRSAPTRPDAACAAFEPHDHDACVAGALAAAERICAERGAQLTPTRRRVLELLCASRTPLGAYDILDRLKADGKAAQPPTVYRALDFLLDQGLAHRVNKLNAFAACRRPGEAHAPQLLICTGCQRIGEISDDAAAEAMGRAAAAAGFSAAEAALELSGLCAACAATAQEDA